MTNRKFQDCFGRTVALSSYVTEYGGRWFVAYFDLRANQWKGPVKGVTDGTQFFCGAESQLPKIGAHSYASRSSAERKAIKHFGLDEVG